MLNISVFVQKIVAPLISTAISMLFNNSLPEGMFSKCFNSSESIHIFESGDSNSTVNNYYRPIFKLPFFCQKYLKTVYVLE